MSASTIINQRMTDSGQWFIQNKNKDDSVAKSCRQAVIVRNRLGSVQGLGIPLWAELKSELRLFRKQNSDSYIAIACHTRANRQLRPDDHKREDILRAVDLCVEDWTVLEREKSRDSGLFGLVNPLGIDASVKMSKPDFDGEIYQVFDESLFIKGDIPETLITNDGSYTGSIEFSADGIFEATKLYFKNVIRANVCEIESEWVEHIKHADEKKRPDWLRFPPPESPKIGILTGNSPESGVMLMDDILSLFRSSRLFEQTATDITMPPIVLYSYPNMGVTMELIEREDRIWPQLERGVLVLLEAGCKVVTAACNTTAYFQKKLRALCKAHNAEFISIVDACLLELEHEYTENHSRENKVLGLIGIGPVIDLDAGYSGYSELSDTANVKIIGSDATELAYEIKNLGDDPKLIHNVTKEFRRQIREDLAEADTVIIALTEASIVYRDHKNKISNKNNVNRNRINFIDPVASLSKAVVMEYLRIGYRESALVGLPLSYEFDSIIESAIYERKYK